MIVHIFWLDVGVILEEVFGLLRDVGFEGVRVPGGLLASVPVNDLVVVYSLHLGVCGYQDSQISWTRLDSTYYIRANA